MKSPCSSRVELSSNSIYQRKSQYFELVENYFSRLLNVHRVSDVRQIEIHTAEPLVPLEIDTATEKLKRYKSPSSNQIPAELIQAEGETLWSEIHKLINSIWKGRSFHQIQGYSFHQILHPHNHPGQVQ
jgi:regulator of sirC expression with transglutaminase-like and TPR domain